MPPAYNWYLAVLPAAPCIGCSANNQRVAGGGGGGGAAAAGAGNAESAGGGGAAASPFGGLGFFGRTPCLLGGFGGGPAGWSSATTGLGLTLVVPADRNSPGLWTTVTGTVAGWNLFSV